MPHWKKLMDAKDMLYAYDLDGRDVTVTIEKVTGGELTGDQGRKTKKPIAHIKGKAKKLALNNTNCGTIEQLYGTSDYEQWKDIRVTLFPTTTSFGGKTVECIRIRPHLPKASAGDKSGGTRGSESAADLTQQIADEMAASAARKAGDADDVPNDDEAGRG